MEGSMRNWPPVTIIVVNRNGLADTTERLESLQGIAYPNYETIVIDEWVLRGPRRGSPAWVGFHRSHRELGEPGIRRWLAIPVPPAA